jgi:hypothetical protein
LPNAAASGRVFGFGTSGYTGVFGTFDNNPTLLTEIVFGDDVNVIKVAAATNHALALGKPE